MKTAPAFSFITATYQCAAYLQRCHWSLARQTISDWEWVVVDDASTDGTAELIAGLGDARIRYHRFGKNQGRGVARNFALQQARGRWLAVQDADDFSLPGRLARADEARAQGFDFLCSALVLIDQDYRITGVRGFSEHTQPRSFPHATLCGEASLLRQIGYPPHRWAEDQTMVLTMANTRRGRWCQEPLYAYHENASIGPVSAFWSQHYALKQWRTLTRQGVLPRSPALGRARLARYFKMIGLLPFLPFPKAYRRTLALRANHGVGAIDEAGRAFIAECARRYPRRDATAFHGS